MNHLKLRKLAVLSALLLLSACTHYTTPGGAAPLHYLADSDINRLMATQPTIEFPARVAIARVQASGYANENIESYGTGRFSLVTTREVESEESLNKLSQLPQLLAVAPLNRIIVSPQLDSLGALRQAAARLRADTLLIYTFDSHYRIGEQKLLPLNIISLGLLDNQPVTVTTTASAALFDVRTEFLYSLAESSQQQSTHTNIWSTSKAVDELRVQTETLAFDSLIEEFSKNWLQLIGTFAPKVPDNATGGA